LGLSTYTGRPISGGTTSAAFSFATAPGTAWAQTEGESLC
jgi:hypothetical protein